MSPNDFGKTFLTEQCQKIRIDDYVRRASEKIKRSIITSELELNGKDIRLTQSLTGFGGRRFWFVCPICKNRAGIIYKHPLKQTLGCRKCLGLDYRKHRYGKMIENGV